MPTRSAALAGGLLLSLPLLLSSTSAQEPLPWQRAQPRDDGYRQYDRAPRYDEQEDANRPYAPRYSPPGAPPSNDPYAPRTGSVTAPGDDAYRPPPTLAASESSGTCCGQKSSSRSSVLYSYGPR